MSQGLNREGEAGIHASGPRVTPEPAPDNGFCLEHARLLIASHRHLTGRDLVDPALLPFDAASYLYHAPFVVLSHDPTPDPRFTYANLAAQARFEMPWQEIVGLPSRLSAEPLVQAERARLLAQVATTGYIDDYCGIRITKSGRRFSIRNATVWNLVDAAGHLHGQAATFTECSDLPVP